MPLIFSPLSEEILEGPFQPYPRTAFIMMQDNRGTVKMEREIEKAVCQALKKKNFDAKKASELRGTKDFLNKIIQLIRGSGFGIAIFSQYTNAISLANIFFEIGLCNILGKPVIVVKNKGAKAPSDFIRTEWVNYSNDDDRWKADFINSLNSLRDSANYYEKIGDLAIKADEIDFELAFERYKQAFLISGSNKVKEKIKRLLEKINDAKNTNTGVKASRKRLKTAVAQFAKFTE
jgi:hypothetical protein